MTDLCATVIALTPKQAATFPTNQGRAVHAFFLRLVGDADADLAARLHEGAQVKPFTCSNLRKAANGRPREPHVAGLPPAARNAGSSMHNPRATSRDGIRLAEAVPGETWQLRTTTLSAELSQLWVERALPALPEEVAFGDVTFRIQEVTTSADEHPWAGQVSYADLASPYLLGDVPAPRRWTLDFYTPTCFQSRGMSVPIPLPDLLFGSLLDRWNAWSPVALNPEVRRFAQECIAVSKYRLRSRALLFGEQTVQRGAVGRCEYVALNRDRYWCSTISTLAAFAFYSGAGYQTTRGMGICRWVREGRD